MTLRDFMSDFIEIYGKSKWSYSTYTNNVARMKNYIEPHIGDMELTDITTKDIESFYCKLLDCPSPRAGIARCTPSVIREISKMLSVAFDRAVIYKLISENPCKFAVVPHETHKKREIWTLDNITTALNMCTNPLLSLAIDLAFTCTLRESEILGLRIDKINMDEGYVFIDSQIQRIKEDQIGQINAKMINYRFPKQHQDSTTQIVLIEPKTQNSIRKVYFGDSLKRKISERFERIESNMRRFGSEYQDHGLLVCFDNGNPIEPNKLGRDFRRFVRENELPCVDFHSLRHSSITYKLKATNGNLKAVQGDAGHAQLRLISEVYSHILDEDRKENAVLLENLINRENTPNDIINTDSDIDYLKLEKMLKTDEGKSLISALINVLRI